MRCLSQQAKGISGCQPGANSSLLADWPRDVDPVTRTRLGGKVVEHLAEDLKREFPDMVGFSQTNLKCMRTFAEAYSEEAISQRSID